jgi:hypothetical protein
MAGEKFPNDILFKTHDREALIRYQASETLKEGVF